VSGEIDNPTTEESLKLKELVQEKQRPERREAATNASQVIKRYYVQN